MVQNISTNTFGVAKWIVSTDPTQGTHTTISAALTAASSGDTILIRDGTYTENITGKAGVVITALLGDSVEPNVTIIGKCTFTSAGTFSISNVRLQTNSDFILAVTGTLASIVNLTNCYLNLTNNTGISFTTSSASAQINISDCEGNLGTTGIAIFSSSSAGTLFFSDSTFTNSGASTTANTNSAGSVQLYYSNFFSPITTSGTSSLIINDSTVDTAILNVTSLTVGGSVGMACDRSNIDSGTASAISISSQASIAQTTVSSSNTNAITGAGTLIYQVIAFSGNSQTINTTTQTGGVIRGGVFQTPSAGFIGEEIRSSITQANALSLNSITPINVTNISLTAGIWDVSGIVGFVGAPTGTQTNASLNTTSATLGIIGDNFVETPFLPTVTADVCLVIPSYRYTLTTTTTIYLVASAVFSVGTLKAYGRISGTRVG